MIAIIENAVLTRLKMAADNDVLGYHWHTLTSYNDEWDSYLQEAKSHVQGPSAWIAWTGNPVGQEQDNGSGLRMGARFAIVLLAESLRNEVASRHGHAHDGPAVPGSYQLHDDVAALLTGETFGLDIDRFVYERSGLLSRSDAQRKRGLSLVALQFSTSYTVPLVAGDDAVNAFTDFHVRWDMTPHGNASPPPFDEPFDEPSSDYGQGDADASDRVRLAQDNEGDPV